MEKKYRIRVSNGTASYWFCKGKTYSLLDAAIIDSNIRGNNKGQVTLIETAHLKAKANGVDTH